MAEGIQLTHNRVKGCIALCSPLMLFLAETCRHKLPAKTFTWHSALGRVLTESAPHRSVPFQPYFQRSRYPFYPGGQACFSTRALEFSRYSQLPRLLSGVGIQQDWPKVFLLIQPRLLTSCKYCQEALQRLSCSQSTYYEVCSDDTYL
jgi:hypothetical protein